MMPVPDLFKDFKFDPETFNAEEFQKSILDEYEKDRGAWDAKITDETTKRTMTENELQTQKLRNYDLLQKIPSEQSAIVKGDKQNDPDPTNVSINDLFGKKDK